MFQRGPRFLGDFMAELYYDATNLIVGRLASTVAQELLKGNKVFISNSGKAVISGKPEHVFAKYQQRLKRGDPYKGPFFPRSSDRVLKRAVRGMLPKTKKGREALKGLRTYIDMPKILEGKSWVKPKHAENKLTGKYTPLSKIAMKIGGKT